MQAIEVAVQASKKFDRRWLQDMYEQIILESTVKKINPLVVNPGIVLLSNTTLYFKSYNNIESVSTQLNHSSFILIPLNPALNLNVIGTSSNRSNNIVTMLKELKTLSKCWNMYTNRDY